MVIDSHVHLGFNDSMSSTADELVASMNQHGVDIAMVFSSPLHHAPTEMMLTATADHRDRLAVVGTVSPLAPDRPDLATVRRWFEQDGVRALKFYLGYEHFYPADACLRPYLELCVELGKPAIFHTGDTWSVIKGSRAKYAHPLHLDDLAADLPDLKIIMAHLGFPWVVDGQEVVYRNENVYADCSGIFEGAVCSPLAEKYFLEAMERFALDDDSGRKILFGSDWPIADQGQYLALAKKAPLLDPEAFWHGNAEKLFGLK